MFLAYIFSYLQYTFKHFITLFIVQYHGLFTDIFTDLASIRKKDNGSYEAMVNRRGVRKSRSFRTKAQAAAWAADVERDILAGKNSGVQTRP